MDRSQLQELIQADLDGELSVAERAELARLLLQDPEARRLHAEFRRTDQLLRQHGRGRAAAWPSSGHSCGIRTVGAPGYSGPRQYGLPLYRMAAAILGGLLIAGLSYVLIDAQVPRSRTCRDRSSAPQGHLSLRAEGAEISASLRRDGEQLQARTQLVDDDSLRDHREDRPCDDDLCRQLRRCALTTSSGQVTVVPATGSRPSCWISPARRRFSWNCAPVDGCSAKAACRSATTR